MFSFRSKVISLVYCKTSHQLISGGEDAIVVFWDMKANRQEVRVNIYNLQDFFTYFHCYSVHCADASQVVPLLFYPVLGELLITFFLVLNTILDILAFYLLFFSFQITWGCMFFIVWWNICKKVFIKALIILFYMEILACFRHLSGCSLIPVSTVSDHSSGT